MKVSIIFVSLIFLNNLFWIDITSGLAQTSSHKLLGDFQKGWSNHWIKRDSDDKPSKYEVVQEDTNLVLMVNSDNSASALWRMLDFQSPKSGRILWGWKVAKSLSRKTDEKTKIGDDYAARLFVVFEPHLVSWKTRAICYVWAAKEPVGSMYKNPYASSVRTVVVESGNERKGKWIAEERDFITDYKKIFGKAPEMISAVAIMVDTDNTGQKATAWFDDIVLELDLPEVRTNEKTSNRFDF
ncbi:MAG: DUF3047 domain-containing protein [bacterium]